MTSERLPAKVLIICSRLDMPGGIERSVVNISNLLHQHGHPVNILVLDKTITTFYPLHPAIGTKKLDLPFGIAVKGSTISRKISFLRDVYTLRNYLKKNRPDIIITTEYPFTIGTWIATRRMKIRLISREAFHFRGLEKSNFWQKLIQLIYPKIDCIVCLNKDEETFFKQLKCTTAVIPNYVLQQNYSDAKREKILLTVCRLSFIKGADLIPAIAENIFRKIHDWKWIVIGNGELEETIRSEISRQKLAGQIELVTPGSCDIREYYEKASLYVSTSRFEAFPNVILEAMSYALSCVSYDCPTGPKHIISHNENGLLIQPNDVDAMANAIGELITNEEKRKALGRNAYQSISRFSPDEIYRLWDAVFAE